MNEIKPSHVNVSTYEFERESGRKPRGYAGAWVFAPSRNAPDADQFWGRGMYGEAKKEAQKHFAALGISSCVLLP